MTRHDPLGENRDQPSDGYPVLAAASEDVVANHLLARRSHSSGGADVVTSRTTASPSTAPTATRAVGTQPISPSSTPSTAMTTAPRNVSGRTDSRNAPSQLRGPCRPARQRRVLSCSRIRSARSSGEPPRSGSLTTAAVACSMAPSSRERGKVKGLNCELLRVSHGFSVSVRTMSRAASYGVSPRPSSSFSGTRRSWLAWWIWRTICSTLASTADGTSASAAWRTTNGITGRLSRYRSISCCTKWKTAEAASLSALSRHTSRAIAPVPSLAKRARKHSITDDACEAQGIVGISPGLAGRPVGHQSGSVTKSINSSTRPRSSGSRSR